MADANLLTPTTYNITVKATDRDGLSIEKPLSITINDINFAPTAIQFGYSIQPKANSTTNTRLDAQASITLNNQTPIQTTAVFNTLDSDLPTSSVNALPTNNNPNFIVSWAGSDTGSSLA